MTGRSKLVTVAVVLDKDTRRAFKIHCAKKGIEMSAWIRKQIEREMKNATSSDWEIPQQKDKPIDEVSSQE